MPISAAYMKEAAFYKLLDDKSVECGICPHICHKQRRYAVYSLARVFLWDSHKPHNNQLNRHRQK